MKNRYTLPLFLLSCLTFSSFASNTWKLQNVEYRVDTLSHIVIGPGTTQTILALEGPVKLRVFYTTTDMTNPNVNLKLIMGKDNLTSNVTVPNMPASHNDPENIYFAGVNADFIGGMGPVGTTVADGELYKSYKGTGWYAIGIDKDKKFCSGAPYTTFKLVSPNAGQASIKAVNAVRSDNELILFTSRKGSTTGTKGAGVEVGAVPVDGPLKAEGTTKMRVTIAPVKDVGNMSIPEGGFVLSGTGFTANTLAKMQLGEEFEVTPTLYFDNVVKTDIMENEKDYEIVMDLPGFKKDEIKGELKDGYLIITAAREQKEEKKDSKGNYIRRERYRGNCSRSFYVGDYMRQEDIKAKFENGTLKLTVPKQEARPEVERAKCIAIEG